MSTVNYLIRPDNKTIFELGKTMFWDNTLGIFKVQKEKNLLENDEFFEECYISCYNIYDDEILLVCLKKHFNRNYVDKSVQQLDYLVSVVDKIIKFCDGHDVYLLNEYMDTYITLKTKQSYIEIGTIYLK